MNQTIYPIGIQNFEKIRSRIMILALVSINPKIRNYHPIHD